jgi:hypothetical protein
MNKPSALEREHLRGRVGVGVDFSTGDFVGKAIFFNWGSGNMWNKAWELGISLRRGSVGEPVGRSFTGDSDKGELWKPSSICMGALRGKPGGRAPLLGTPKDMQMKAL